MVSLKEAIQAKHTQAEQMTFNQRMFRGELTVYEYRLYLYQLIKIFTFIEKYPLPHPSLNRLLEAQADLNELRDERPLIWTTAVNEYATYLDTLTQEQLLPHVYLNYMALFFGGQMMKQHIPGEGRIYQFKDMKGALGSVRAIQQDSWADEANKALDYNIQMFDELQQLSERNS